MRLFIARISQGILQDIKYELDVLNTEDRMYLRNFLREIVSFQTLQDFSFRTSVLFYANYVRLDIKQTT